MSLFDGSILIASLNPLVNQIAWLTREAQCSRALMYQHALKEKGARLEQLFDFANKFLVN